MVENTRERERLRALVNRLTDEDLSLPLGNNWTIGAVLAHLVFWDQRSLVIIKKWKKSGVATLLPMDVDVINEAMLPLCLAIPARVAENLAIASAEEIDRELEQLTPELITAIENLAVNFRFRRSEHRKLHLDKIELILKQLG